MSGAVRRGARRVLTGAPPEAIEKWKIVRGDLVQVMRGKDAGKQGVVMRVDRKFNRMYVEGVRLSRRSFRGNKEQRGGTVFREAPVPYAAVALVDPTDSQPCRVRVAYLPSGDKVRVSKRTGAVVQRPATLRNRKFTSSPIGPKDTPADAVVAAAFDVASLLPRPSDAALAAARAAAAARQQQLAARRAAGARDAVDRLAERLAAALDVPLASLQTPPPPQ